MATKKQIILPIAILAIGLAGLALFSSMKKPPQEKKDIDNTPIVATTPIVISPMTLDVSSHGMVTPKYETELIAQVSGEIVELSDTFVRGGFVNKDQLLARVDPSDYHAALIDAQASMATARAALETELAQGKVAEREWNKITNSSPTELSLRKPQLAQELARVKAAQASVLRAERNLERTEIRSPYDAMIESRNIGLGSFVGIGNKIGHVLATDTAKIRLPVADNQLEFLIDQGVGSNVELIGVYAGKETRWRAKIMRSEGVVDSQSRMGYLVAELNDPYRLKTSDQPTKSPLRFGSYINAHIVGKVIERAAVVPRHLVVNGKVAVLDSDSTLRYQMIDIVRQQGSNVIVASGLAHDDQLIVSALDYPIDGMKLALASNMPLNDALNESELLKSERDKNEVVKSKLTQSEQKTVDSSDTHVDQDNESGE